MARLAEFVQLFVQFGLIPQGVRVKLMWAFVFMSAIPLTMLVLVAAWFGFPYTRTLYQAWFPVLANPQETVGWLVGIIMLTLIIAFLGSIYLTIKIVEPVIRISHEAKEIAKGNYGREVPVAQADELGELGKSINQLTERIRGSMSELKQFGERTTQINLEIHKRVMMLSGLLQISELISNAAELEVLLDLVIEKITLIEEGSFSFLCLQRMEDLSLTSRRTHQLDAKLLNQVVFDSTSAVIDATKPPTKAMHTMWESLAKPNLILQPVVVRNRPIGVLGVGNHRADYAFPPELIDLVSVFVKQTSIAIENELLIRKTKVLTVRDEFTGLYTEPYIRTRLEEEIKRAVAYQRPCAFAMFQIEELAHYRQARGDAGVERAMKKIAQVLQETLMDIDRAGRFSGDELVVILPERNKRQAIEIGEEIRRRVGFAFAECADPKDRLTLVSGVSENPIDGVTAEELIEKASQDLHTAATPRQNLVGA